MQADAIKYAHREIEGYARSTEQTTQQSSAAYREQAQREAVEWARSVGCPWGNAPLKQMSKGNKAWKWATERGAPEPEVDGHDDYYGVRSSKGTASLTFLL